MVQGKTVVDAPKLDERTDRNQNIQGQHDCGDRITEAGDRPDHQAVGDRQPFARSFAGHGDIDFLFHPVFRDDKQQHRQVQQQHGHGGAALHIVVADRLDVYLGRQGGIVAADGHRIGEVGHRFDKHKQERVGDAGADQRRRYPAEGLPA